jgi:hypothetical protein
VGGYQLLVGGCWFCTVGPGKGIVRTGEIAEAQNIKGGSGAPDQPEGTDHSEPLGRGAELARLHALPGPRQAQPDQSSGAGSPIGKPDDDASQGSEHGGSSGPYPDLHPPLYF